jgi:hypothetical protein
MARGFFVVWSIPLKSYAALQEWRRIRPKAGPMTNFGGVAPVCPPQSTTMQK